VTRDGEQSRLKRPARDARRSRPGPEIGTAYVPLPSCRELDGATAEAIGALLVRTLRAESAVTGMVVL